MAFLIGGANTLDGSYEIGNSGLFGAGIQSYLSRTFDSSGSQRKFTTSLWVKRSELSSGYNPLWAAAGSSGGQISLVYDSNDKLILREYNTTDEEVLNLVTSAVFRDPTAWYHIVAAVDTTQSTNTNRAKLYVNGVLQSLGTATYPNQNYDLLMNDTSNTGKFFVGNETYASTSTVFDGYIAEFHFINDNQLAASDFAERDDNGFWSPKKYSGSYGTNGFFLEFGNTGTGQGAGRFASDTSGEGNHLDTSNFSGQYQMTDSPTNNFCTLNPLNPTESNASFSKGNLAFTNTLNSSPHHALANGTIAVASGKWYWEAKCEAVGGTAMSIGAIEVTEFAKNDFTGDNGVGYFNNGNFHYRGTEDSDPNTYTTGDIIGIALDMDNRGIYFHKNGTYEDSGDPTSGASRTGSAGGELHASNVTVTPAVSNYNAGNNELNFGNPIHSISSGNADANGYGNFEYAVPSGYYALCSKNLGQYG